MEDMGEIFGTLASSRLSRRMSRRARAEEARINELPARPGDEKTLSEHIPSALVSLQDHDLTVAATTQLQENWHVLAQKVRGNRSRFAAGWHQHADQFDFRKINDLVEKHNRYFPAEANLPMDIKTLDYVAFAGGDYRRQQLDAAWILAQFPPDLDAALASPPPVEPDRRKR
jgi:hypothetical protein